MVTTNVIPVGFGLDLLVVKTDERSDSTKVTVTYKGKSRSKTFRGEVSHHDAARWAHDLTSPIVFGVKSAI